MDEFERHVVGNGSKKTVEWQKLQRIITKELSSASTNHIFFISWPQLHRKFSFIFPSSFLFVLDPWWWWWSRENCARKNSFEFGFNIVTHFVNFFGYFLLFTEVFNKFYIYSCHRRDNLILLSYLHPKKGQQLIRPDRKKHWICKTKIESVFKKFAAKFASLVDNRFFWFTPALSLYLNASNNLSFSLN